MDLGFVLGFTSEMSASDFDKQLDISKELLTSLSKKTADLKAGIITYGNSAILQRKLTNTNDVDRLLYSLNLKSGDGNLKKALQVASDNFFLQSSGGRRNSEKTLVVFVSETMEVVEPAVKSLRDQGVNIVSIGVGGKVEQDTVDKIAGDGKNGILITKDNDPKNIDDVLEKAIEDSFTGM